MSKFVLTAQLQLQAPTNVAQVTKQIQNQLSNVNVNIQAKGAAQTTRQVKDLTKAVQQADSAAFKLGKTFTTSLKRFAAFSVATRAVSLFTQGIGGAVDEAIKFERELIKVAQVTGKTVAQLSDLTNEIRRLATNLGVSSSELLNVSRALSQAGFSARETKVALDALAKSSLAPTFEDMAKTAEGAIAIFNQFGKGAAALESQLGAINAVAGQFAVEAGDLISVIRRTGGVFKAAGGDLNELIALFTSVRATTRESAESIATGLRTIFTRIQRPRTIKFLESLGVSLVDLEGKFVGPFEAIKRLSEALGGLEAGDLRFVRIAEELGGFRQIGKVIPLLNQFGVAQEAYNAALGGANSLTKDAETAQQSLAVQLQKLREQWLATVRSITESTGFKIAVEAALSLASAVLNIADALKSVLPLLAAFGAFKIAKGMGGFLAGAKSGVGSGIPKFASGGLVPGTGSRDTVPAMLTPGEFVIRKSSVQKMGAKNLQDMNVKGYAGGGEVKGYNIKLQPDAVGGFFLRPEKGKDKKSKSYKINRSSKKNPSALLDNEKAIKKLVDNYNVDPPSPSVQEIASVKSMRGLTAAQQNEIAANAGIELVGQKTSSPVNSKGVINKSRFPDGDSSQLDSALKANSQTLQNDIKLELGIEGTVAGMILGDGDTSLTGAVEQEIKAAAGKHLKKAIKSALKSKNINKILTDKNIGPVELGNKEAKQSIEDNLFDPQKGAIRTISGYIQEGLISRITGATVAGDDASFDFPNVADVADRLKLLYGSVTAKESADAKPEDETENNKAILRKYSNSLNKDPSKFASKKYISGVSKMARGGPAPSDTVPAMLTPGEFVISKKAAQSIGPANLDRMNKKGVQGFAKGGPVGFARGGGVQKFAMGGGVQSAAMFAAMSAVLPTVQAGFEAIAGESEELKEAFAAAKVGLNAGMAMFAILFAAMALIKKNFDSTKNGLSGVKKSSDKVSSGNKALKESSKKAAEKLGSVGKAAKTTAENFANTELDFDSTSMSVGTIDNLTLSGELMIQAANVVLNAEKLSKGGSGEKTVSEAKAEQVAKNQSVGDEQKSITASEKKLEGTDEKKGLRQQKKEADEEVKALQGAKEEEKEIRRKLPKIKDAKTEQEADEIRRKNEESRANEKSIDKDLDKAKQKRNSIQAEIKTEEDNIKTRKKNQREIKSGKVEPKRAKKTQDAEADLKLKPLLEPQIEAKPEKPDTRMATPAELTQVKIAEKETKIKGIDRQIDEKEDTLSGGPVMGGGLKQQLKNKRAERKAAERDASKFVKGADGGRRAKAGTLRAEEKGLKKQVKTAEKEIKKLNKAKKAEQKGIKKLEREKRREAKAAAKAAKANEKLAKKSGKAAKELNKVKGGKGGVGSRVMGGLGKAAGVVGGLAPAIGGLVTGFMSARDEYTNIQFEKALASGDPADLVTARQLGEQQIEQQHGMLGTNRVTDTLTGAAAGAALGSFLGPIGMAVGGVIGGAGGFFKDEIMHMLGIGPSRAEKEEKARNELNTKLAETNLDKNVLPALKKSMESFVSSGSDTDFGNIISGFETAQEEISTIAKTDKGRAEQREKELEGRAKVLAGSIGSSAASQAELNKRILELSKKFPELSEELENTAKSAFILAEANRAQIKMQADILKVSSTFRAASLGVNNFLDSLQTGANSWNETVNTLKEAQQNIALGENAGAAVQEARDRVKQQFAAAGAGDSEAAAAADRQFDLLEQASNFSSSLPTVLANTTFDRGATDEAIKSQITDSLLGAAGVDADSELGKVIAGRAEQLTPEQLAALRNGTLDLSEVFSDLQGQVSKLGSGALAAAEALQAHENTIIKLTAARIKAEQGLIATQKKAVDLQLEAAQIAAKFGGTAVTAEQRRNAAIEKFNLTAGRLGAGALTTGTGADIRTASGSLTGQFAALEMRANRPGGFQGAAGLDADKRNEIAKAQSELVGVTKALIEADKQELDIIKKKNALEKESLDKLISGDTAGFVQGMAANAATSLIASGDASGLSGDVLAKALENIRKQREAGVSDIDGVDIRTVEQRAAQAALAARGVTDPRAAAMVAGQTREEEEIEARIRERAGALGAIGENMVDMAQMQVQTAEMTITQANVKFQQGLAQASANVEGAAGFAKGGVVYASRGMFIPRGTDTVPAMLTPGEFVVNRASVNRGNNLQILRAINNGNQAAAPAAGSAATMNQGGQVRYYNNGDLVTGAMDGSILEGLNAFNTAFAQNIANLQNTRFQIKLDTTNVVVTLNGGSFLNSMKEEVKSELLAEVGNQISNLKFNNAGEARVSNKVLDQ